ncbi:MAG: glycosyltransferase family 2 protein [Ignavibacteriales bacterium]|nr:glycosyltransferase family 2 protein [Ignavibacteriales bacterium]
MKEPAPSISIVTAVLNSVDRIGRSIECLASSKRDQVEYIVVDGGSTDGTLDVVREHGQQISVWLSEPDEGISHAFNKGIRMAKGEIVGLLNAGDWYESGALVAVEDAFDANPEIEILCGAIQFWEAGSRTIVGLPVPDRLEQETSVYHPAVFVRKTAYMKYGEYDETYHYAMDYELLLRFKHAGAKFLAVDKVLANMSLDGISYKNWYKGLREVRVVRSRYSSPINVAYRHWFAVIKNLIARELKCLGLVKIYQSYWLMRNRRMANQSPLK